MFWKLSALATVFLAGCATQYPRTYDIVESAFYGDTEDVKRHLAYDPGMIDGWSGATGGTTISPLHSASSEGHLDTVKLLVKRGARTRVFASGGVYAIHSAAIGGHTEIVEFFVDKGVDIDAGGADGTALHYAIEEGHIQLVEWLLEHGADVNKDIFDAPTPLHVASREGRTNMARILVSHGADLDARDQRNRTPYDLAVANEHSETAEYLRSAPVGRPAG